MLMNFIDKPKILRVRQPKTRYLTKLQMFALRRAALIMLRSQPC